MGCSVIGSDTFSSVFGGAPSHTVEHMVEHVRAIIRAGYSPVLLKPGSKDPACILSTAQAKAADRAEQQRREAMNPGARVDRIRHPCGMAHVIEVPRVLDPETGKPNDPAAKVKAIVDRFLKVHGGMNVGLHLGRSRLLAVDVDTPAERNAFEHAYGTALTWDEIPGITVESPGSFRDGAWVHYGGGHWVFQLPDDYQLPAGKVLKGPGGWAAMWGNSYILTPPSNRPEGPYRLVGGTTPAPGWLLDQVSIAGEVRQHTADQNRSVAGGPIDVWSAVTSWESLLAPQGWIETSMVEGSCGCPVWTAPGDHSSPKSATAHDLGCARFDVSEGWGPLKIWTDHPPEPLPPAGAVTKLQYVAMTQHGGDIGAATKALQIERAPVEPLFAVPEGWGALNGHIPVIPESTPAVTPAVTDMPDQFSTVGDPVDPSEPQADTVGPGASSSWDVIDLGPFLDGTYQAPVPRFLRRSDGQALFYPGLTHSVYGETESGKSWIALLGCAQALREGGSALWMDLESDPGAIVARLRLLGCTREQIMAGFHYVQPWAAPSSPEDVDAWLERTLRRRYDLAVLDAMSGALGLYGLKSKDDDDVTRFYRVMPNLIVARTGAAVVTVDHVVKDKETRGRWPSGSERKVSALTGCALSVRRVDPFGQGRRGASEIWIAKDRAGGLRGLAGESDRDGMQQIGEFILDATAGVFGALINPQPTPESDQSEPVESSISAYLSIYPGATVRAIREAVPGRAEHISAALQAMATGGVIRIDSGARGSHHHYLMTPLDIVDMSETPLPYISAVPVVPTGSH